MTGIPKMLEHLQSIYIIKKRKVKSVCNKKNPKKLKTSSSFRWDKVNDSRENEIEKKIIIIQFLQHKTLIPSSVQIWWQPCWAVHDTINKGVSRTHQSLIETINLPSYSDIKFVNSIFDKHSSFITISNSDEGLLSLISKSIRVWWLILFRIWYLVIWSAGVWV